MKVYSRTYLDWINGRYVVIVEHSRLLFGPVIFLKGASSQQKQLQQQQTQLSQTLSNAYNQAFANQHAVFSSIRAVFDPIFNAGPSQYGFANAEDVALRTQASEGTAQEYQQASRATAERMAAEGGGNSVLPSGVQAQIQGQVAGAAAESESNKQLDITKAGYEQGRQNFLTASNAEMAVAQGYNPLGYAGAAGNTTGSAFNMATEIQKMNNAASPWGAVGGILGGLAGSIAGPLGTSIGSKLGGMLGGGGSPDANQSVDYGNFTFPSNSYPSQPAPPTSGMNPFTGEGLG